MFEVLRVAKINVQTMQNKVFEGANAAVAIIDIAGKVSEKLTGELGSLDNVILVRVTDQDQ